MCNRNFTLVEHKWPAAAAAAVEPSSTPLAMVRQQRQGADIEKYTVHHISFFYTNQLYRKNHTGTKFFP